MKKYILFMITMLSCILAFAQNQPNLFKLIVKTKAIGRHPKLYLAYQLDGKKIIDSANYNERKAIYVFSGNIDKPLLATLVADYEKKGLTALMKKTKSGAKIDQLKLYLHTGTINLAVSALLSDGKITGSTINADHQKLKPLLASISNQKIEISNKFEAKLDHVTANYLNDQMDSLRNIEKLIVSKFIQDNPNSYFSLISLVDYAGSSPEEDGTSTMYYGLSKKVRNTLYGKEFRQYLINHNKLVIGTKAPEFTQNDTVGRPISLSSFRGKYVLLDFWASWCGPCRVENPNMRQLYQHFKNRNFTILGISLDGADGKAAWIKAIHDDNLTWTQVSDLKHWNNEVSKLYCIYSIPTNFLIDPNGIIIAKGSNYIELKDKLDKLLPKND